MVGPVEVAEDRAHVGAERFLRLDELALEKADQRFPLAGLKRVVAEFENGVGHARTLARIT